MKDSIRSILNFVLTFVVLLVATTYFSEYVSVTGTKELIITTLLLSGLDILFAIAIVIICIVIGIIASLTNKMAKTSSIITIVLMVIACILWIPTKLAIVSNYYEHFSIADNWLTYVVLTICLCAFSIKTDRNKDKKNK